MDSRTFFGPPLSVTTKSVCPQDIKSTNETPIGGDVKEERDVFPLGNEGAIHGSTEKRDMDHSPDCQIISQTLHGKDGHIKECTSELTGIIEFKIGGKIKEAIFNKSAVIISGKEQKKCSEQNITVGKLVHFNANMLSCSCKKDVKVLVTDVWFGKKDKSKKGKVPLKYEIPETLNHGIVYKATVIDILNPFKFVAQVDNSTFQVLVSNYRFSPSPREPPLTERDRVAPYISLGGKVSLIAEKYSCHSNSKYNWAATQAWLEDEDFELNNSKKGNKHKESMMTTENVLEGEVYKIENTWGMLMCKTKNLIVIFHSKNLRLFGLPIEGIHLNHLKLLGEKINFVLEENHAASQTLIAQRAWLGSWESINTQQDVIQCSMRIFEFCKAKNIGQQVSIHLAERIAGQRTKTTMAEGKEHDCSKEGKKPSAVLENTSQAEEGEQSNRFNDRMASCIDNDTNTEKGNYTADSNNKGSSCQVTASIQEAEDVTSDDINLLSQSIRGIVESYLSTIIARLNIDSAVDEVKIEVCKILKGELLQIVEGDFLEKLLGINPIHTPRNDASKTRSVFDVGSQTLSTGPVMFWEVTTDL